MTDTRKNRLLRTVLFSGLGIFACLLLGNYTNLPSEAVVRLGAWWVYLFFIAVFNLLGEVVVRMSVWLNNQYLLGGRRLRLVLSYTVTISLMFGINYALLVAAKLLAGAASPFTFPNGGMRILTLVWLVELVVLGLLSANYSMRETLRLQRLSAALQKETDAARYTVLQQQLDPHFLFNNLNALIAEIEYDPVQAVIFTRNLSDVYRYVLQSQHKRLVTLDDELHFASAYLFLHRVRLGDCIRFETHIAEKYMEAQLPPLTLQLLLENVVKHNVVSATYPMLISLSVADDVLSVANTFHPRHSESSTGVGLRNLHNRCLIALGRGIEIRRSETRFIVKIPLYNE
ncbi:MAG: histidine kinase [Alistipes sp.]|uniref:sensor histidine kinase n=1 Tax=Alistipes sp. TaxID=1872444 RepID=UPI0025C3CE22|nr:histidine kinase [Alistipes sp.]MCD8275066.1 histidine kinase [Alistipes sp.]